MSTLSSCFSSFHFYSLVPCRFVFYGRYVGNWIFLHIINCLLKFTANFFFFLFHSFSTACWNLLKYYVWFISSELRLACMHTREINFYAKRIFVEVLKKKPFCDVYGWLNVYNKILFLKVLNVPEDAKKMASKSGFMCPKYTHKHNENKKFCC